MRIFQTMAGGIHGGAETFFEDLVAGFARAGHTQFVATRPAPDRLQRHAAINVPTLTLPFKGRLDLYSSLSLGRSVRRFQPDVVLGWMNRACSILPRGPFVTLGRLGGYYNLKYYRRCDGLICNTRDIRDYVVREGWPAARAFYVPNFCPELPDAALPRTSFGTPSGTRIALVLARLEDVKGVDIAIRALTLLPDVVLWIAGEGRLQHALLALAKEIGVAARVRFLGWRNDRGALLKTADICWVPSRYEPFGNVVVNAWMHRIPVVATRGDGPGVLIKDGETGLLVPIDDAQSLAESTRRVLADPQFAKSLTTQGYAQAQGEFSEGAVINGYLNVFTDMQSRSK